MSFVSTTFTPAPSGTLFIYYRIPISSFFATTSRFLSRWRWMRSTIWRALRMVPGCISYIYYQRPLFHSPAFKGDLVELSTCRPGLQRAILEEGLSL